MDDNYIYWQNGAVNDGNKERSMQLKTVPREQAAPFCKHCGHMLYSRFSRAVMVSMHGHCHKHWPWLSKILQKYIIMSSSFFILVFLFFIDFFLNTFFFTLLLFWLFVIDVLYCRYSFIYTSYFDSAIFWSYFHRVYYWDVPAILTAVLCFLLHGRFCWLRCVKNDD